MGDGPLCWKPTDLRVAAVGDNVHMAEISWRGGSGQRDARKAFIVS